MIHQLLGFVILFAWLLLAIAVVVYFVHTQRRRGFRTAIRRLFSSRLLLPLVLVIGLNLVHASLVFIYPQQVGVVISVFSEQGIRPQPLRSGLHWIIPLAERVVRYPVYWQTYTMSGKSTEGRKRGNDAILTRTLDNQKLFLDITIIFRINPEQATQVHTYWQDRYVKDLLRPMTRGVVRDQVAKYTVEEANSTRRHLLIDDLNTKLKQAGEENGLIVEHVVLRNIVFSSEYAASVESKQVALEGKTQKEYEAKQIENLAEGRAKRIQIVANAEADAIFIKAEAQAKARVVKAEAEAKALRLVADALAGRANLLTYRYINKLSPSIKTMLLPDDFPLELPFYEPDSDEAAAPTPAHSPKSPTTSAAAASPTLDATPTPFSSP